MLANCLVPLPAPRPALQIRFRFPNARIVHAVVDRMRALSKTLRIDAVRDEATAVLSVKSETVAMRTFFRDLPVEEAVGAWRRGAGTQAPLAAVSGWHHCRIATCVAGARAVAWRGLAAGGPDVPSATVHVPIRNMARALKTLSAAHSMMLMCECWSLPVAAAMQGCSEAPGAASTRPCPPPLRACVCRRDAGHKHCRARPKRGGLDRDDLHSVAGGRGRHGGRVDRSPRGGTVRVRVCLCAENVQEVWPRRPIR